MKDNDFETSPNGSNGSSPNHNVEDTGKFEVDGQTFDYRLTENEIEVEIPEDFPEEKKPALLNKVEEFKHTLASAKKKVYEANQERQALAEKEAALRKREEELARKESELLRTPAKPTENSNELLATFGVETWDDVQVLQAENPAAYHEGLARYNAQQARKEAMQSVRMETTRNQILAEGYNPFEVEAFAKANEIGNLQAAFDYFKRVNAKPKGQSLADIQKMTAKLIPKSSGSAQDKNKKAPSLKEMYEQKGS